MSTLRFTLYKVRTHCLPDTGIPGAAVQSTDVAEYFHEVFSADLCGYDIYPYVPGSEPLPDIWRDDEIMVMFPAKTV